ncbi:MAG: 16S rRNA methyltransferase [Candidatus Bathyarchaeia archaeon]
MLTLIIAESALEVIPEEIRGDPRILAYSKRAGKDPCRMLLDKSYHYAAMGRIDQKEKRGRPDIVHLTLLEALGSPLNLEGLLQTYVHTINDQTITINPKTRIPRNYNRFVGLMEQLFQTGKTPMRGDVLLELKKAELKSLIKSIGASYVYAFSRVGRPATVKEIGVLLRDRRNPAILVGGFPKGHLTPKTLEAANDCFCVDPSPLDAWVVVSRVISAYEEAIGLPERRLSRIRR